MVSFVAHQYSRVDFYSSLEVNLSLYYGGVNLNSPHQQKAPVSAYWQSIMGNRLHGTQECARFYFSTRYVRLGMAHTSPTLYCICLVTVLSMLKRLKSAIAVSVFEQSDLIFLCVLAIHARRTICKDYLINCLSILYKTFLCTTLSRGVGSSDYIEQTLRLW